jgi:hypothetical protein
MTAGCLENGGGGQVQTVLLQRKNEPKPSLSAAKSDLSIRDLGQGKLDFIALKSVKFLRA